MCQCSSALFASNIGEFICRCEAKPENLDTPGSCRYSHIKTRLLIASFNRGIQWKEFGIHADITVSENLQWLPDPTVFPPSCPSITHYTTLIPDSSLSHDLNLPVKSWIKQFRSVVPELYTIHQIPLSWRRGCQISLQSFSLFTR